MVRPCPARAAVARDGAPLRTAFPARPASCIPSVFPVRKDFSSFPDLNLKEMARKSQAAVEWERSDGRGEWRRTIGGESDRAERGATRPSLRPVRDGITCPWR